jgi:lipid-binding SYLF domain-containing protein
MRIRLQAIVAVLTVSGAVPLPAQTREEQTVAHAVSTLDEIMAIPIKRIPESLLADAHAVAIVPNVVKGGFVVGVRHGRGVLVARDDRGHWQPPTFLTLSGGSVGWQAGVQATDVVLVFATRKSVDSVLKGKLTVGVDAAAAAGPVGRQAAAATDPTLKAEIYSYSRSRGLFAGVSIDGSVLEIDPVAGQVYYQGGGAPGAEGAIGALPESALTLLDRLETYSTGGVVATEGALAGLGEPTPAVPLETAVDAEPTRRQLVAAAARMEALLDARWRRYLALPPSVYRPQGPAPTAELESALARFDGVAIDARYAALAERPEFAEVHGLLRAYLDLVRPTAPELVLPPPPQ